MKKILDYRSYATDSGILLLRLLFGGMFVYFGYGKIENYDAILPQFGDIIGIGSKLSFWLVIFAEFFCGLLVTIGLFTRLATVPVFITMIVAYFIAHKADPFEVKHSAFIFLILSVVIFILGPGKYSLDKVLFRPKA